MKRLVELRALSIIALESATGLHETLAVVLISLYDVLCDDGLLPELNATTVPVNQKRRLAEASFSLPSIAALRTISSVCHTAASASSCC